MSNFFGRVAQVVVEQAPQLTPAGFVGPPTPPLAADISSPLRIQFKVEKQLGSAPNTADISITNLAEATRKNLQVVGVPALLFAGYQDQPPDATDLTGKHPLVFRGAARTIDHYHRGAEWVTRLQCGDGELAYRYAQSSRSWGKGTSLAQVIGDLASDLKAVNFDVAKLLNQISTPAFKTITKNKKFVKGHSAAKKALAELTALLAPFGYSLNVQDGRVSLVHDLDILAPGEERLVPLISPETGLIGQPEVCSPTQTDEPAVLRVSSLLLPQLAPGDFFVLQTSEVANLNPFIGSPKSLSGAYRANKVTHSGDTHGGDWKTEIEALPDGAQGARVVA